MERWHALTALVALSLLLWVSEIPTFTPEDECPLMDPRTARRQDRPGLFSRLQYDMLTSLDADFDNNTLEHIPRLKNSNGSLRGEDFWEGGWSSFPLVSTDAPSTAVSLRVQFPHNDQILAFSGMGLQLDLAELRVTPGGLVEARAKANSPMRIPAAIQAKVPHASKQVLGARDAQFKPYEAAAKRHDYNQWLVFEDDPDVVRSQVPHDSTWFDLLIDQRGGKYVDFFVNNVYITTLPLVPFMLSAGTPAHILAITVGSYSRGRPVMFHVIDRPECTFANTTREYAKRYILHLARHVMRTWERLRDAVYISLGGLLFGYAFKQGAANDQAEPRNTARPILGQAQPAPQPAPNGAQSLEPPEMGAQQT